MDATNPTDVEGWLSLSLSLCLGFCDKYQRVHGLNNKYLFFTVLEVGKLKIKVQQFGVWWEPSTWFADVHLVTVSSDGQERERSFVSFLSLWGKQYNLTCDPQEQVAQFEKKF
jgi:hypothetical protein